MNELRNSWITPTPCTDNFARSLFGSNWRSAPLLRKYQLIVNFVTSRMGSEFWTSDSLDAMELAVWYLWERLGYPTWRIEKDLIWFLENVETEAIRARMILPRDVLCFCFPYGYTFEGIPLRSVTILFPRSDLSLSVMQEIVDLGSDSTHQEWINTAPAERSVFCVFDVGETTNMLIDGRTNLRIRPDLDAATTYSWSGTSTRYCVTRLKSGEKYLIPWTFDDMEGLSEAEVAAQQHMLKLAYACILYVNANNEVLKGYRLTNRGKREKAPRGTRYVYRMKNLPQSKHEYERDLYALNSPENMNSRTVRPHIRGWVLRTLRAERYKRNEDGTPRVILVPPCLVGTKKIEDASAGSDQAVVWKK